MTDPCGTNRLPDNYVVIDDLLPADQFAAYHAQALRHPFSDVTFPTAQTFKGVALAQDPAVALALMARYPAMDVQLSFLRQSPEGQVEPTYIHSDQHMGDWMAVYYLTTRPDWAIVTDDPDGTIFWERAASGAIAGPWDDETQAAAQDLSRWYRWAMVLAVPNRVVLFHAALYHSRALLQNFGQGESSRLVQVLAGVWR